MNTGNSLSHQKSPHCPFLLPGNSRVKPLEIFKNIPCVCTSPVSPWEWWLDPSWTRDFTTGCTSSPSSCSDLSPYSCSCQGFLCPFLNLLSQWHYHLHCWAQPWPVACPSWSCWHWLCGMGKLLQLLTEGTPVASPLPKPCHESQIIQGIKNSSIF